MAGMVLLEYTSQAKGIPVETSYTLKDDKCWKMTIRIIPTDAGAAATAQTRFDEAAAGISKVLGEPEEKNDYEGKRYVVSWKSEKTTSLLYFSPGIDERAGLNISFESPVLSGQIWGKFKKP